MISKTAQVSLIRVRAKVCRRGPDLRMPGLNVIMLMSVGVKANIVNITVLNKVIFIVIFVVNGCLKQQTTC